ncbi:hypothetical protein HK096_010318 [Nowakowskiella sp. JEL0078]|nr:hypothetical protein HK096_010318 [Nowakowskiella sp. JEL0078]
MIISDRTSNNREIPGVDVAQQILISTISSGLSAIIPNNVKTQVSFTRSLVVSAPNKVIIPGTMSYIYAYSSNHPNSDNQTSLIKKHDNYGSFSFNFLDFSKSNRYVSADQILPTKNTIVIHGVIMTLAWVVFPFLGIFVARHLKPSLGKWWYHIHVGLMFCGVTLLSLVGIIFIVIFSSPPHFSLESPHKPLGLMIGIDSILQTFLGFACNVLYVPDREKVPWWDILHWWNGRLLVVLSLLNYFIGLNLANVSLVFKVTFFGIVAISIGALIAGHFVFGINTPYSKKSLDAKI